jgi:trans-2-enoyl-CoA reductase
VEKRFLDVSSMKDWKHWIEACEDVDCLVKEMAT